MVTDILYCDFWICGFSYYILLQYLMKKFANFLQNKAKFYLKSDPLFYQCPQFKNLARQKNLGHVQFIVLYVVALITLKII